MDRKKVCAIVPSYKEEKRIGEVLKELKKSKLINEIIVVDDGSKDNTKEAVKKFKVRYIQNNRNYGKAFAMNKGIKNTNAEIILFCDADLKGFNKKIINSIISPVLEGECEMCIATRKKINNKFFLLSGQRAITRELWDRVPNFYKKGFRIELGLNFSSNNSKFKFCKYQNHIKENKYGLIWGTYRRFFMMWHLLLAYLHWGFSKGVFLG